MVVDLICFSCMAGRTGCLYFFALIAVNEINLRVHFPPFYSDRVFINYKRMTRDDVQSESVVPKETPRMAYIFLYYIILPPKV